jgi:hypothetical protein
MSELMSFSQVNSHPDNVIVIKWLLYLDEFVREYLLLLACLPE